MRLGRRVRRSLWCWKLALAWATPAPRLPLAHGALHALVERDDHEIVGRGDVVVGFNLEAGLGSREKASQRGTPYTFVLFLKNHFDTGVAAAFLNEISRAIGAFIIHHVDLRCFGADGRQNGENLVSNPVARYDDGDPHWIQPV